MILPWLAQPLTPLLWAALGVTLLLTVAAIATFRRSPERCPISPRWLTVSAVVAVGFFAAMSWGGQLINPITVYASVGFMLVSTLIAWGAWHAEGDPRRAARVTAAAIAAASTLATACVLVCAWLLSLATKDMRLDLDLGLGAGEAVSQILPATGAALVPLMLLPASHHRTAAVRRAVVVFGGLLLLLLACTTAAALAAMTTPLPYESPLSDRYIYLNSLVAVPVVLGAVCAVGAAVAVLLRARVARAAVLLLAAAGVFAVAFGVAGAPILKSAFGFDWWRPAAAVAGGLLIGAIIAPIKRAAFPLRILLLLAALIGCGALGDNLSVGSSSHLMHGALKLLAVLGLFAASAVTPAASEAGADTSGTPHRPPLAVVLLTGCVLVAGVHAYSLALRSELTYQARRFSAGFDYSTNHQVDPEMRAYLQGGQHAIHVGGTRWAWVLPQATWWTRDGAWRDAVLIADHAQPHGDDPVPTGHIYQAVITGADRKRSDISFTDAGYIALVQPVPVGQKSTILHTVTARFATDDQLLQWLRLTPSNFRVWLGAALSLPLAWWLTRKGRTTLAALAVAGACVLACAFLTGVAGVLVVTAFTGLLLLLTSARRDDDGRSPAALLTLTGISLALLAAAIPLAEVI